MTVAEWRSNPDSQAMLRLLRSVGTATPRKLRLFAVACCDWREDWLPDKRSRNTVHVAARYADGNATAEDLASAHRDAQASFHESVDAFAAVALTDPDAWIAADGAAEWPNYLGWEHYEEAEERRWQANVLRCIFANPFCSTPNLEFLRTSAVLSLVQTIYQEQCFDQLPILADALESAGCTNEDILRHCREPGEHVRGCWVVDLLLGKS